MNDVVLDKYVDRADQWIWILLVLVVAGVMIYGLVMRRHALRAFISIGMMDRMVPRLSVGRQYTKMILFVVALTCIVAALIGPRWGTWYEQVHKRQLDLMICLDVSRSMLAEDAGMSRLARAKDDINRLIDRLGGGQIGLVTFAGKAELACPLTDDYEFYRLALEDVGTHSAPVGGTNLGRALLNARKAFGGAAPHDRAILLITDGEDHGGTAIDEAKAAAEEGIVVFTIGIGDDKQGSLVPIRKDGRKTFLKHEGQQLWSKMNPARLTQIAQAAGGEYHPSGQVTDRERTLEWIYRARIEPMQQVGESGRQIERRHVRFHWFAAMALALLTLESLVSERKSIPASRSGVES